MFKKGAARSAALGVLGAGILAGVAGGVSAPLANAAGCGGGSVPTTSWATCDYGWFPDGGHTHCDAVFVFGFGGWNCFFVPGGPPPAP